MSIAAQKWAWDQNIPASAKFVLIALADQTDARDGAVRYQDTTADFFAYKCCLSVRAFWRHIADLESNGYLRRDSGRGRGGSTEFFLILNREVTPLDAWDGGGKSRTDGFIYIAQANNRAKIGITTNVETRIQAMSQAIGAAVTVIKTFSVPYLRAREIEALVCKQFAHCSTEGEWFDCEPSSIADAVDRLLSENVTCLAHFSERENVPNLVENVPNQVIKCASVGTPHIITNQLTQETSDARSRSRGKGRAPARQKAGASETHMFVDRGTPWWDK